MSYSRLFLVRFEPAGRSVVVSPGTDLLEAVRRAGLLLSATCNGQGDCGECGVTVLEGQVSPPTEDEEACRLNGKLSNQHRLACRARVLSPVKVYVP